MAANIDTKKVAQAQQLLKEGDKSCTKTMFRWKPDWERAVHKYEQAVKCLTMAGRDAAPLLLEAHKKCATAHYENGSYHMAGKSCEQAAQVCSKIDDCKEAPVLYQNAALHYRESGNPDKAAAVLVKAARMFGESQLVDEAIQLYSSACELLEDEDRGELSNTTFNAAITYTCRVRRFEECLGFLKRQCVIYNKYIETFRSYLNGDYLAIIVVLLEMGQVDRARDELARFSSDFVTTEEHYTATRLIEAYSSGDGEKVTAITKEQLFELVLDNQLTKLARKLKIDPNAQQSVVNHLAADNQPPVVIDNAEVSPPPAIEEPDDGYVEEKVDDPLNFQ